MNEMCNCKQEANSRWKLDIAHRLAFTSRSRIKKATAKLLSVTAFPQDRMSLGTGSSGF